MDTEQVPLEFWDWIAKVGEKLLFLRLKALDHKDLTEDDYHLQKVLYKVYDNGDYPLHMTKLPQVEETASQNGLFTELNYYNEREPANGMNIEEQVSEPIKEKENDT